MRLLHGNAAKLFLSVSIVLCGVNREWAQPAAHSIAPEGAGFHVDMPGVIGRSDIVLASPTSRLAKRCRLETAHSVLRSGPKTA